mmetsp:Transcript_25265/g.52850  ORF Transcript_25265/g.52850 Transcript_25265/m.52850 type:complete len:102 (-) Transcript_25265:751-1056(-)
MFDPILHDVSIRPLYLSLLEEVPSMIVPFLHYSANYSLFPMIMPHHPFRTRDKRKSEHASNIYDISTDDASYRTDADISFDVLSSLFLLHSSCVRSPFRMR